MTTTEHLLTLLSEECSEVSQRASKAIRFGLNEIQPEQPLSNAEHIVEEIADFMAVVELLEPQLKIDWKKVNKMIVVKKDKIRKFMEYSSSLGIINHNPNNA